MKYFYKCSRCEREALGDRGIMVAVELERRTDDAMCASCIIDWFEFTYQVDKDVQTISEC